jgi:hypothetical protein
MNTNPRRSSSWWRLRTPRRVLLLAALAASLASTAFATDATAQPAEPDPERRPNPPVPPGLEHDLEHHPSCPNGFRMIGTDDCSHGPDGPAPGAPTETVTPLDFTGTSGPSPVFCFGSGTDGARVQVVYVRYQGTEDRYDEFRDSMRQWAADVDDIVADSALGTRGIRRVRFVTDSGCNVSVARAVIPAGSGVGAGLKPLGFNRSDRKYLVFLDTTRQGGCGYAGVPTDDQPGSSNEANYGPTFAVAKSTCGWNAHTAAHELTHTIGAVQLSAPNSSGGYHCTDEYDVMCYSDEPDHPPLTYECTPNTTYERLLDCHHDDYFHTAPSSGSYLANHWNTARSRFLEAGSSHWVASRGGNTRWADWRISGLSFDSVVFADLDGDGTDDAFRTSSGRWYYAASARDEWRRLADRSETVSQLLLGDFDGDGQDDALRSLVGRWEVSRGATQPWSLVNLKTDAVSALRAGDFDGDGRDDVLRSYGGQLQVAWSGAGSWQSMKTSAITVNNLRLGDFDGNGTTDVFYRGGSGTWYVSYSNTSRARWTLWTAVQTSSKPLTSLAFGRFNDDATTDVFTTGGGRWLVSFSTTDRRTWSRWTPINSSAHELPTLRLADVDGGRTDILRFRP